MKRTSLLWVFIMTCIFSSSVQAQSSDSITIERTFWGNKFHQNGQNLRLSTLIKTMEVNEVAYQEIKSAQSSYIVASIVGGTGGYLIGWPIGTAIGGGEPKWELLGIGTVLAIVSIPITHHFNQKAKKAINIFNAELEEPKVSSFFHKTSMRLNLSPSGLGFALRF